MQEEKFSNKLIKEFSQKRGFSYRKFSLYSGKVIIETRTIRSLEKYEGKIENVGFDTLYEADNVAVGKILFFVLLAVPILAHVLQFFPGHDMPVSNLIILYAGCWFFALLNFLKQHQDDIILKGKNQLVFYHQIPSEEKVLEFIDLIKETTKKYLKHKYLNPNNFVDENKLRYSLNWLLETEIISNSEYKDVLNDFKIKNI